MQDERYRVIDAITTFLDGTGGPWDWRKFIAVPLRDAELDRIRRSAAAVDVPLDGEGRAVLRDLLDQVKLLIPDDPEAPKIWRMGTSVALGLAIGAVLWWLYYLPGQGLFHNLHLLLLPVVAGAAVVLWRNSRVKVGAYDPRIVDQNRRGRV